MTQSKKQVCRVRELFTEKVEREDANFATLEKQYGMGSAKALIRFMSGATVFPVQCVPEMARYLGVDPAWLLRIYLEDHFPATLAAIDGTRATMLLTQHERNLVLENRRVAADQASPLTARESGQWSSLVSE